MTSLKIRFTIISAVICVLTMILVRLTDMIFLSGLLNLGNITHLYSPFHITYPHYGQGGWTEGKLLFFYTFPYLVAGLSGTYLPLLMKYTNNWIVRLSISWVSFHLILMVVASMITGLFQYRGLGVPLDWFLENAILQIIAVIIIFIFLAIGIRRFCWHFLSSAPDYIFMKEDIIEDEENMKSWLRMVVLIPFAVSTIVFGAIAGIEVILNSIVSLVSGLILIAVINSMVREAVHFPAWKK